MNAGSRVHFPSSSLIVGKKSRVLLHFDYTRVKTDVFSLLRLGVDYKMRKIDVVTERMLSLYGVRTPPGGI
jgi:hypothetical protein